jgi:hypothetical protein
MKGNVYQHVLFITILLLQFTSCHAKGNDVWTQWLPLAQFLLAFLFVSLGLHLLLYSHLATHSLMKVYLQHGDKIAGNVLDCTPSIHNNQYEITVLYHAVLPKYKSNPRLAFRHLDAPGTIKRFMRRYHTNQAYSRGMIVDVLLLPGIPSSGLLLELVETIRQQHSHCRTILILVPGLCLIGLILWMAILFIIEESYNQRNRYILVLVLGLGFSVLLSNMIAGGRWEQEKVRRFYSSIPTTCHNQQNKDPLIPKEALLVVQGYTVIVKEGPTTVMVR